MTDKLKIFKDIRYFESADIYESGIPFPTAGQYKLELPIGVQSIGQRISCMLYLNDYIFNTYDHLYLTFTESIPEGEIVDTKFGFEDWHRYVMYGVSKDFKNIPDSEKLSYVQHATFRALEFLQQNESHVLIFVKSEIEKYGSKCRILRMYKETKKYRFEVLFDVPNWRETSYLYVTAKNLDTGDVLETKPFPLKSHSDAFPLVATLSFSKDVFTINPRKSFRADFYTKSYGTPIKLNLSDFSPQRKNDASA